MAVIWGYQPGLIAHIWLPQSNLFNILLCNCDYDCICMTVSFIPCLYVLHMFSLSKECPCVHCHMHQCLIACATHAIIPYYTSASVIVVFLQV